MLFFPKFTDDVSQFMRVREANQIEFKITLAFT